MKGKMLLGIGAAVGYVLGARAGRDRYNEIKAQVDALWHDPRLQDKLAEANHMVREHAPEVPTKLADAASAVKAKVQSGSASDAGDDPSTTPAASAPAPAPAPPVATPATTVTSPELADPIRGDLPPVGENPR